MKKKLLVGIAIVVCAILLTVGLVGCVEGGEPEKLATPVVTLNEDVATWEINIKALSFELSINGSILKVDNTTNTRKLPEGATFKVRAIGDGVKYTTSDWSNLVTYTAQTAGGETKEINFVMINDTHGAFTDSAEGYSIGRVDSLITSLKNQKGDQIFIHNGDAFQGSYVCGETYGLAMVEAFNAMELDCFVIGNHEFDWGIDKIAAYADGNQANGEANFPFLGANIYLKGTQTRPSWIDAYHIVEQDGVKVGIIGIMGDDQESSILTRYVKDYDFVAPLSIVSSTASYLRNTENCDVVVVATHDYNNGINESIASLSGDSVIDAIFCAHSHQNISEYETRADGKNIPVVQCYHKNNNLAEVVLKLQDGEYSSYYATKHLPGNYALSSKVQTVINKYQDDIDESNEVLGTVDGGLGEVTLGAYATDAMLEYTYSEYTFGGVDVSVINTGGVRAEIDSGDVTRGEVYEVFPFNNSVVLVNISGALIKSLINENSKYLYYDVTASVGTLSNLDDSTIYQLAVVDFVFEGTYYDQFDGLSASDYIETEVILRDLLMTYIDEAY